MEAMCGMDARHCGPSSASVETGVSGSISCSDLMAPMGGSIPWRGLWLQWVPIEQDRVGRCREDGVDAFD
jgi:hypothetical protein